MQPFRAASLLLLCAAVAAGCSSNPSGNSKIDYAKKAVVAEPLDVPPPLKLPAAGAEGVEVPAAGAKDSKLLPQLANVRMVRDGEVRWLVVDAGAETLWPKVHQFLKSENLEIKEEDQRIGLIETDWAENLAGVPDTFIQRMLSKMHDTDMRDKYRLRLERGAQPNTTEIFLTHYGAEKVNVGETFTWQARPSDPELVAELLSRMMQFLGVTPEQAKAQLADKSQPAARARVDGDALVIDEGFARAWRLTGLALDRVGLVVEDLDREKGLYFVRQTEAFARQEEDKRGFFSRMFSSDKAEEKHFRLMVKGDDNSSRLSALNDKGEALPPDVSKAILTRLQEQLR